MGGTKGVRDRFAVGGAATDTVISYFRSFLFSRQDPYQHIPVCHGLIPLLCVTTMSASRRIHTRPLGVVRVVQKEEVDALPAQLRKLSLAFAVLSRRVQPQEIPKNGRDRASRGSVLCLSVYRVVFLPSPRAACRYSFAN